MEALTWSMLLQRIEQMTEQERQETVKVWGKSIPLSSEVVLAKCDENMYCNDDFDGISCPESELYDVKPEDCRLVAKAGMYYLDA